MMTLATAVDNFIGGFFHRKVNLLDGERVLHKSRAHYKAPTWGTRPGRLFLTNERLMWGRFPPLKPKAIPRSEVRRVYGPREGESEAPKYSGFWGVETDHEKLSFTFGYMPHAMGDVDKWVDAIRKWLANT